MKSNKKSEDNSEKAGFIDPVIHTPARFQIMANLFLVESADFLFLLKQTGLTKGNLSSHLAKLEKVKYINIEKKFVDKIPRTIISLSNLGRVSFNTYRKNLKNMLNELPD